MESHEALSNTINRKTSTHAKALGLSVSTVSKWQEPSVDFSDSGAFNPLDRIETIISTSIAQGNSLDMALSPVYFLAEKFNFVPLLLPATPPNFADISRQLHKVVCEFGHVIQESADALDDGKVSPDERRRIEREAQHLYSSLGLFLKQIEAAEKKG
jgi:hypothetical protein